MEGLVPRFELDTPRVNSEAPIGLIKKTSTKDKHITRKAEGCEQLEWQAANKQEKQNDERLECPTAAALRFSRSGK